MPADNPRSAADRAQEVIASPIRTDRTGAWTRPAGPPSSCHSPGEARDAGSDVAAGAGYTSQLMALSVGTTGKV